MKANKIKYFLNKNNEETKNKHAPRKLRHPRTRYSSISSASKASSKIYKSRGLDLNMKLLRCFESHCKKIANVAKMKRKFNQVHS